MTRVLTLEMAALFLFLQIGTQKVATGAWPALPPLPMWLCVGVLLATALAGAVHGWRTVRRIVAEHAGVDARA
jgi:membrane protein implicated in regulation of membrane protease activity